MIENHFLGKPEIYWIGLTSLVGVATLMIIFFYTLYTRRMMKLAEENRRADISVVLSLREYDFGNFLPIASRPFEIGNFICVVRNIGRAQLPVYKRGTTKLVIDSLSEIFRSRR